MFGMIVRSFVSHQKQTNHEIARVRPAQADHGFRCNRVAMLAGGALLLASLPASAAINVSDLASGVTPNGLVATLLGPGITASNIVYKGAAAGAGTFTGGVDSIGFDSGIILSCGRAAGIVGPNNTDSSSTYLGSPGDSDLSTLISEVTNDAAVLEFDFVPTTGQVRFQYVFASEEYNEFVGSAFNDVFAFFVNGVNRALLPDEVTPVSINNVNGGRPIGINPKNPDYYVNNDCNDPACPLDMQADGRTITLTLSATVQPNQTNHVKLAIADARDAGYDSWVLLRASSLQAVEICDNEIDDDGDELVDLDDPDCHICGDGTLDLDGGEQCDDGNTNNGDGCSQSCQFESCGNGTIDPLEECDDGNNVSGDGCQGNCRLPVCGDSVVDVSFGEECDDGNLSNGDDCSATCQIELRDPCSLACARPEALHVAASNAPLIGTAGNDILCGDDRPNLLRGGGGDDLICGGGGNDKIYGEAGNDTLYGEAGNDILSGGSGQDQYFGQGGRSTGRGNDYFIYSTR